MLSLATAAQMKELDRRAIEERGIPSLELMDHAAQVLAVHVREIVEKERSRHTAFASAVIFTRSKSDEKPTAEEKRQRKELEKIITSKNRDRTPRVAIFCGPGNNGGDGIAAARYLGDYHVRVFLVGDRAKMTPDARAMEEKLVAAGGCLEDFTIDMTSRETLAGSLTFEQQKITIWLSTCDCMVDALFGIGPAGDGTLPDRHPADERPVLPGGGLRRPLRGECRHRGSAGGGRPGQDDGHLHPPQAGAVSGGGGGLLRPGPGGGHRHPPGFGI